VSQEVSPTAYALLGLLVFDGEATAGLTGYELKQRADNTLRFYWVSPAMSQVYTELERLAARELVQATIERTGKRTSQRYQITPAGLSTLHDWLLTSAVEFPLLKHPTALRLLMGSITGPEAARQLLERYQGQLSDRRRDLVQIRESLGDDDALRFPAMVADWGLHYYDSEAAMVDQLIDRL
jgi:DNA-binding PadR family transcriptional regulator